MAGTLQRYYAGDGSLMEEIEANAVSRNPVSQMARAALDSPVEPMEGVVTADATGSGVGLETLMMVGEKVTAMDTKMEEIDAKIEASTTATVKELWALNGELHHCREKMKKQTAAIAHLNSTIRTKDAELRAKDAELRAKDAELRAKDAELAKLRDNSAALDRLQVSVSDMVLKLDTAMAVFM